MRLMRFGTVTYFTGNKDTLLLNSDTTQTIPLILSRNDPIIFTTSSRLPSPLMTTEVYYAIPFDTFECPPNNTYGLQVMEKPDSVAIALKDAGEGEHSVDVITRGFIGYVHSSSIKNSIFPLFSSLPNLHDTITLWSTGQLPLPLKTDVYYSVVNKNSDGFQLSLSTAGDPITLLSSGEGIHFFRHAYTEPTEITSKDRKSVV